MVELADTLDLGSSALCVRVRLSPVAPNKVRKFMATKNDITGATIVSKSSKLYEDNYDSIFRKPNPETEDKPEEQPPKTSE